MVLTPDLKTIWFVQWRNKVFGGTRAELWWRPVKLPWISHRMPCDKMMIWLWSLLNHAFGRSLKFHVTISVHNLC